MGTPHLLKQFVEERRAASQQFVDADGQRVLIGVAPGIALPLLRRHIGSRSRHFAQRGVCLHAKIKSGAKIREQYLPVAPDQQISRLDILVDQPVVMHVVERGCRLLEIRYQLFRIGQPPAAIGLTKEVENGLRRVFHYQVGASILQVTKIVDG